MYLHARGACDFFLFLRRDHDPATAAAVAVHRACNNRLRYNATAPSSRQHHARDRSALYCCVELLWKAPEIHHPSHLLVPGISRLLLLSMFCFVRHKTQMHVTAHNCSVSAKSTLQLASQSRPAAKATPCTCGRYALYVVELLSNLRSVTHHIYLLELCSSYMLHVFARTWGIRFFSFFAARS